MSLTPFETGLRDAAMTWLDARRRVGDGFVRHEELASFEYAGQRVPLMDRQRGIRKPAIFEAALS
ncbi:MAG TPA: hypothetical protein VNU66_12260, partial [Mycobacteriales bacterium]|nr:hypothetical protein [Mycobacteriales bacterium]